MSNYLLIDMGNSRCKAALTTADELNITSQTSWDNADFDSDHWLEKLSHINKCEAEISKILISSVSSEEKKSKVSDWCHQVFKIRPIFFESQDLYASEDKDLINSYDEPVALGVDRWLVMVGAFERTEKAFAVIDAGTAITLDLVDKDGKHLGGHIVPGARLMQKALFGDTGKIAFGAKLDSSKANAEQWLGQNSLQAVELGTYQAAVGYLSSCLERLTSHYQIEEIYVCGGDGAAMMQKIKLPQSLRWVNCPDLVLEGLFYQFQNG